jgi:hypothetical protein
VIEFTEWARDILRRADEAARRLNPDARVRLARTGTTMSAVLTDAPEPGDADVDLGGFAILVAEGVEGLVDIEEPHDRIVLRPAGSTPNPREG